MTVSLAPEAAASARRCGHSISTGGNARNIGPGKSPGAPMAASANASSITSSARRSDSAGADSSSTGTKSTVPAMLVRRPPIGNREMRRMPEWPAVSSRQLSCFPAPSEVTHPGAGHHDDRPAATIESARPMPASYARVDHGERLAAPMTPGCHQHLAQFAGHRLFVRFQRCEQPAPRQRQRRQRQIGREMTARANGRTRSPCRAPAGRGRSGTLVPRPWRPGRRRRRRSPRHAAAANDDASPRTGVQRSRSLRLARRRQRSVASAAI